MEKTKNKNFVGLALLYIFIVLFTNLVVSSFLGNLGANFRLNALMLEDVAMDYYPILITLSNLLSYGLPTSIIVVLTIIFLRYLRYYQGKTKTIPRRFRSDANQYHRFGKRLILNMTLVYASTSIMGWFIVLIFSYSAPRILNVTTHISYYIYSLVYYMLSGILCFTIVYYLLEYFNRKRLIPYIFDENEIISIQGVINMSLGKRLVILFLSTILTPLFLAFSIFETFAQGNISNLKLFRHKILKHDTQN